MPSDAAGRETRFFKTGQGLRLCYGEYGAPDGAPLFYFHGWPSSRLQAWMLDATAKEHGYRVIAPDRPGMGRSEFVPGRKLRDWPPIVGELATHLGLERFAVMGVSGGGPYALACAHDLEERVSAAAVVSGAPPLRDFPDRSEMVPPYRLLLAMPGLGDWFMPPFLWIGRGVARQPADGALMRWFIRMIPPADRAVMASTEVFQSLTGSFLEGVRQGTRNVALDGRIYLSEWGLDFSRIRVPVLFWHGMLDRNIPFKMAKALAAQIPTAETRWFADEGHYSVPLKYTGEILARLGDTDITGPRRPLS